MKFFKRKKKKKLKTIKKEEYSPFLTKIDKAIKELTVEYSSKSRKDFLEEVKHESNKWFNFLEELETNSFKAGVCYAVFRFVQLSSKGKEKESYVV